MHQAAAVAQRDNPTDRLRISKTAPPGSGLSITYLGLNRYAVSVLRPERSLSIQREAGDWLSSGIPEGSDCASMAWLLAAPSISAQELSHDSPSATHARGYAGAQPLAADPILLRSAGLPVCPPLRPITGSAGAGGDPRLADPFDGRQEAVASLDRSRRLRTALSLQGDAQEGLDLRGGSPGAQAAAASCLSSSVPWRSRGSSAASTTSSTTPS